MPKKESYGVDDTTYGFSLSPAVQKIYASAQIEYYTNTQRASGPGLTPGKWYD